MAITDFLSKIRGKVCPEPLMLGDIVAIPEGKFPETEFIPGVRAKWAIFVGMKGSAAMVRPIGPEGMPGDPEPVPNVIPWRQIVDEVARAEFFKSRRKPSAS